MRRHTTSDVTAGSAVGRYLTEQLTALQEVDRALRDGDQTVIHAGRVATRRTRSVLRVFAALFEPASAQWLDRELRWWAGTLGPVRDLQVLQDRLDTLLAELDDDVVIGPVRTRIDHELCRDRLEHWTTATEALTGARHAALLDEIARWAAQPPWTDKAGRPASTLTRKVLRADRKARARLKRSLISNDPEGLHRARKAAKRVRYAAEVAAPVSGKKSTRLEHRYRRLQELLGEHHDSTVSAQLLLRLGHVADQTAGESGFTFGLLHERELQRTRKTERKVRRLARQQIH